MLGELNIGDLVRPRIQRCMLASHLILRASCDMRKRDLYRVVLAATLGAAATVACSLDESGALRDGGTDVVSADGPDAEACAPCSDLINAGWQLAAYTSADAACPTPYSQESVVSANVSAGACDCACNLPPNLCQSGTLTQGVGAGCNNSIPFSVDAGCVTFGSPVALQANNQVTFVPTVTACSPQVIVDAAALAEVQGTVCHPPTTCDESLCSGSAPTGFASCVASSGDVSCPDAGGFTTRIVVGATATLSCSSCSCGAANVACGGNLGYYADSQCTNPTLLVDAGAGCQSNGQGGTLVASYRWNASVLDAGCQAIGAREASVGFSNERTFCCR